MPSREVATKQRLEKFFNLRQAGATVRGEVVGGVTTFLAMSCYVESAAGVSEGARTGLANLVTGSLFLAAIFFSPLASMIGGGVPVGADASGAPILRYPTLAPALIVVGSMMLMAVRDFEWDDPTEYIPTFLITVGIPLTFSIADGIAFGFISYAAAKTLTGRWRECHPLTYFFAGLFALQFILIR